MACICLVVLLLACYLYGAEGAPGRSATLHAPYRVRWYIEKNALMVNWRHNSRSGVALPMGFYIQLQELEAGGGGWSGPPDFVRVKNGTRTVRVLGLKPEADYALKVVAFTETENRASRQIHVKTEGLEFLEARGLNVSSISDSGAVFTWSHPPENNVHDIQFKLSCRGVQRYHKEGEKVEEEVQFEHLSPSTSRGKETFMTSSLLPNTQYTCSIQSVAGSLSSVPHSDVTFTTEPGNPSRPPKPRVAMSHGEAVKSFSVEVYKTDDQFGPISHYTVFAVPVYRGPSAPRSAPYTPSFPYSELVSKSVSAHLATEAGKPIPFIVGQYEASALPDKLVFDGSWRKRAFKPETHYAFVVAAYSKAKSSSEVKYTISEPSDPPVHIGPDVREKWIAEHKPATARFAKIILYTVSLVAVTLLLAMGLLLGVIYWKKKGEQQRSAVSSSDDSEVELFSAVRNSVRKGRKGRKRRRAREGKTTLKLMDPPTSRAQSPRPRENLAEWAVKAYQQNAEFDAMIYRSPKSMQQMEDLLQLNTAKPSRRVDQIKKTSVHSGKDLEGRPEKFSMATPPPSPRPSSPLLKSSHSRSHQTLPHLPPYKVPSSDPRSPPPSYHSPPQSSPLPLHLGDYSHSPVATVVDHDDILAASFTLPSARPYTQPTSYLKSQNYYKTHKPGTPMPMVATPKTPPVRQGRWGQTGPAKEEEEEFVDALTGTIPRGSRRQQYHGQYMRVHEDIIIN